MPTGRKKGAAKTDHLLKLNVGDLVLAKVKGFPPWPAKIGRAEEWKQEPDSKKVFVQFFGTGEIAFVAPSDVQIFNVEARKSVLARLQGKSINFFAQAVKEICDVYDKHNVHAPTNFNEVGNIVSEVLLDALGSDKSVEDCVVTAMEDNHLDKSRMKPQMGDDEPASDHCLTKSDETNVTQTMSNFSCPASEKASPAMPLENNIDTSTGAHFHFKMASLKTSSYITPSACNATGNQSEVALKKRTDQVISAFYTKGSRIKKFNFEANGFKVVTKTENVDSIIHAKVSPKADICGVDLSKGLDDSVREEAVNNMSTTESVPAALNFDTEAPDAKETFRSIKRKKVMKIEGSAEASKNRLQGDISEQKLKAQLLSEKTNVADNERSCSDSKNLKGETCVERTKKYQVKKQRTDSSNATELKEEKYSELNLREETSTVSKAGDGTVLALAKECILALEASSTPVRTSEKKVTAIRTVDVLFAEKQKSLSVPSRVKQRAVCIVGCIEETPKTPVHERSSKNTKVLRSVVGPSLNRDAPKQRSQHRQLHNVDSSGSEAIPVERSPKSSKLHVESVNYLQDLVKIETKDNTLLHVSHLPGRTEFKEYIDPNSKQVLLQSNAKNLINTHEYMKISGKVISNDDPKSTHVDDVSGSLSVGTSRAQKSTHKNNSTYGDILKMTSKVQPMFNHAAMKISLETSPLVGPQRTGVEDPSCVLRESRISDSDQYMKHLIAAAQAKRKAFCSQSISQPVNSICDHIGNVLHKNSSPRMMQDMPPIDGLFPIASLSNHASQFESEPQLCTEKLEGRASSVHQSASSGDNEVAPSEPQTGTEKSGRRVGLVQPSTRCSLSGGTEASVARDAFEGMIETLSRKKESIGRATRLAIDCAKYGIANQIVELLIQKLENEPNLHHRVDLFFLVDSIMQRSHKLKGIAGDSYFSTVEAALPRLLGAAAPSGAGARENRRQCLKVLQLWLERKILPASVVRRSIDDISFKRPSRAERSFDDPIREMEDILVDEYGSNATMQLPGFLASRIFEEEEEDDDDDDDDDNLPSPLSNVTDEAPHIGISNVNQNLPTNQLSDGRNCSQKNEDGELEMVDVSGNQKGSCPSNYTAEEYFTPGSRAGNSDESTQKSCPGFTSLFTGSPPLPLGSPSPPPPLPSSPAPCPPPPPAQQCPPPSQQPQPPPPPQSFPLPPPPLARPFQSYPPPKATNPPLHSSYTPYYPSHAPFTSTRPHSSIPPPPPARPILMPVMQGQYAGPPQNSFARPPMTMLQTCVPSTARENLPLPICANAIQHQYGHPIHAVNVPPPVLQPPSSHFPFASSVMQQRPYCTLNQPFNQRGYYQPACQIPNSSYSGSQQPYNATPSGAFAPGHGAVHRWPRPDIAASNCQRPA